MTFDVAKQLVEVGAYTDLDSPVILASGRIGVYYVNTEKLLEDDGAWKAHKGDSRAMIEHAIQVAERNPNFAAVINEISSRVEVEAMDRLVEDDFVIVGGETRDWIFSGPVAGNLGVPHISLYKDGKAERVDEIQYGRSPVELRVADLPLSGFYGVLVSDLLTSGSSTYFPSIPPTGWAPHFRRLGGEVDRAYSVVDRMEWDPEVMRTAGLGISSLVHIDEAFVGEHSTSGDALLYVQDPDGFGREYVRAHGIDPFLHNEFKPENGKRQRAARLVFDVYPDELDETVGMDDLDLILRETHGYGLDRLRDEL